MNVEKVGKYGRIFILLVIFFLIMVALVVKGNEHSEEQNQKRQEVAAERFYQKYDDVVELLKEGKWRDAAVASVNYRDCPEFEVLYYYANAKEKESNDTQSMTKYYLDKIPDDYNGEFADEIKNYKQEILDKEKQKKILEEKQRVEKAKEREKHLYIGDSESKIRKIFGTPDQVNRHVSDYATTKQYVYFRSDKMICIYTKDGIVTDFQD